MRGEGVPREAEGLVGMKPRVGIVMGSSSDRATMEHAASALRELGIEAEVKVLSAHRTPDALREWVGGLEARGIKVVIAGAGGAAHLAGAVAAHTTLPVIGVPLVSPNAVAGGLDALLSTAQMPRGVPVATVAVGEAGAANAGILAAQILATADPELAKNVRAMRKQMADNVLGAPAATGGASGAPKGGGEADRREEQGDRREER